jgi:hypothetical protein
MFTDCGQLRKKCGRFGSKAAIKTGCGLVTAFVPECGYEILQIAIPK